MDHGELHRHLNDPTRYVVRVGVPVFGPHTKVVDGQPKTVDEGELYEWERQSKTLEQATGVAGVLRVGHIRPAEPETSQPPVAGYLTNPRVGLVTLKDGSRVKRLLMDEHVRKEWEARIPDFPWRSVEMYRPRKQITAVAMLTRDPQLHDLGPANLYQHAGPDGLELYSLGAAMDDPNKPAAAPAGDPTALSPEEQQFLDKLVPILIPKLVEAMKGGGGPAAPAGPPPEPMSKNQSPEFYALQTQVERQRAENERLAAGVKAMQQAIAEEKAKAILKDLQAEHYAFDPAAELSIMTATDDAGRAKRAADIRRFHGKVPAEGKLLELFQGHVEGGSAKRTELTREEMAKAVAHATETGKPFATVRKAVLDGTLTL